MASLSDVLAALDAAVAQMDHTARSHAIQSLSDASQGDPVPIGSMSVPAEALMPREILAADRVRLRMTLNIGSNLSTSLGWRWRRNAKLDVEWRATECPESTSLVRTAAEADLARKCNG